MTQRQSKFLVFNAKPTGMVTVKERSRQQLKQVHWADTESKKIPKNKKKKKKKREADRQSQREAHQDKM